MYQVCTSYTITAGIAAYNAYLEPYSMHYLPRSVLFSHKQALINKSIFNNRTIALSEYKMFNILGDFEVVELCVPDVNVEMCEETFPATVYLTNFR